MKTQIPITRAHGMGPLPELLEAREGARAVARAFEAEGLPLALIEDRAHWIPLAALFGLFERSARAAGDPLFGLNVGHAMAPGDFGLWVRHALQADTFGEATARLSQGYALHQVGGAVTVTDRPNGRIAWQYRPPHVPGRDPVHHTDHVIPVMIRFARAYLGPGWTPDRIEVGYPDPGDGGAREAATGTPWHFERSGATLVMPAKALAARRDPVMRPDAAGPILTSLDTRAERQRDANRSPVNQIAAILALRLLDRQSDIEGAAQMVGLGRRTLQRLLAQEGLTYRALLDEVRMARAKALIEETGEKLTDIAYNVGYSDPAHFTRAFGRRFGHPPSRLRRPVPEVG